MNTELLMVIADAIAGVALDYDIEIGPRGMVAMSASVLNAVEGHLADNELDDVVDLSETDTFGADAYDEGYLQGRHLGRRSPIESYAEALKSAKASLSVEANQDFKDGFCDGLVDAGE